MKNLKKKSLAAILAIAMLVTALIGTSVYAAEDYKNVTAQLSPHFTILIDGIERDFYNAQGQEVVEPGAFRIWVGHDSREDSLLQAQLHIQA